MFLCGACGFSVLHAAEKLNPIGILVMFVGLLSLVYSKLPNIKDKKFITSGVDQIETGYKVFYTTGVILLVIGIVILFSDLFQPLN